MINKKNAEMLCDGDITKIRRYAEAVADDTQVWDLHHCIGLAFTREELKEQGLYYKQPPEYLMFMTHSEHAMIHSKFREKPEEIKRKISNTLKGVPNLALSKTVYQFTGDGELVATYRSRSEAIAATGFKSIPNALISKAKSAGGYLWSYSPDAPPKYNAVARKRFTPPNSPF